MRSSPGRAPRPARRGRGTTAHSSLNGALDADRRVLFKSVTNQTKKGPGQSRTCAAAGTVRGRPTSGRSVAYPGRFVYRAAAPARRAGQPNRGKRAAPPGRTRHGQARETGAGARVGCHPPAPVSRIARYRRTAVAGRTGKVADPAQIRGHTLSVTAAQDGVADAAAEAHARAAGSRAGLESPALLLFSPLIATCT